MFTTLYMMKISSASSSSPASTARATTQPGTGGGGSATQTTDTLTWNETKPKTYLLRPDQIKVIMLL